MKKKFASLSFAKVVILSLAVVLFIHCITGGIAAARDAAAIKNGSLKTYTLSASDFEMESMAERKIDGQEKYVSTDSDPQMILTVDGKIRGMTFYMDSSMPAGDIVVYYTTAENQGFSEKNRVWAKYDGEGMYHIDLSGKYVHTLRIDPTVYGGNFMTFGEFVINPRKSFAGYLNFSFEILPFTAVYTGILASFIRFVQEIFTKKSD